MSFLTSGSRSILYVIFAPLKWLMNERGASLLGRIFGGKGGLRKYRKSKNNELRALTVNIATLKQCWEVSGTRLVAGRKNSVQLFYFRLWRMVSASLFCPMGFFAICLAHQDFDLSGCSFLSSEYSSCQS